MRDIDVSLLRAFVWSADAGSFSRAARHLNRTQSALSMQIKRLEQLLDADLFERSCRPPRLTARGESFLSYARRMVALNDAAFDAVSTQALSGEVRLAIMEDYAATHLPPVLRSFLERHPDVHVEVVTGLTNEMLPDLGARHDIVVAMLPGGTAEGELLCREKPTWAGLPGTVVDRNQPLALALYPHGCQFRRCALAALDARGRHWHLVLVSGSLGAVAAVVRQGCAVSVFKESTLPPGLVRLSEDDGLPDLPAFDIALYRAPSAAGGAAGAFADHLVRHLRVLDA